MGWLKDYPRNYYEKYERVEVENDLDWYEVFRLPHNVFAIAEPQQLQEVNAFLIIGSERNLLIDTGMGIFPIRPLVEELLAGARAGKELAVANTHCHFDHIGSNGQFDTVYVHDDDYVKGIAARGIRYEDVGSELTEECFQFGYPKGFNPEDYRVEPYDVTPVADGHIFDLGGRIIRVVATGGHCPDHICLYDETYHIFFTGDFAYHGALFANFDNEIFGKSDLKSYTEKMMELDDELPADTKLYVSHNDLILDKEEFHSIADSFREVLERVEKGDYPPEEDLKAGFDFGEEGRRPHIFDFGDYSIYTAV